MTLQQLADKLSNWNEYRVHSTSITTNKDTGEQILEIFTECPTLSSLALIYNTLELNGFETDNELLYTPGRHIVITTHLKDKSISN